MSNLHNIFRVYFCGCPKMIKIKKSINKQKKNKQTNTYTFLDPKYLNHIESDLYKTFNAYFCGCPKMIETKTNKSGNEQINKQIS